MSADVFQPCFFLKDPLDIETFQKVIIIVSRLGENKKSGSFVSDQISVGPTTSTFWSSELFYAVFVRPEKQTNQKSDCQRVSLKFVYRRLFLRYFAISHGILVKWLVVWCW
jgi:hypothetical protein